MRNPFNWPPAPNVWVAARRGVVKAVMLAAFPGAYIGFTGVGETLSRAMAGG